MFMADEENHPQAQRSAMREQFFPSAVPTFATEMALPQNSSSTAANSIAPLSSAASPPPRPVPLSSTW